MSKIPSIAIAINGGLVQSVTLQDWPPWLPLPRIAVVDSDIEGAADKGTVRLPVPGGDKEVHCHSVRPAACESGPEALSPRAALAAIGEPVEDDEDKTHACYDAAGKLTLKKVTPVIRALFASFHVNEYLPGCETVNIAQTHYDGEPEWGRDVLPGLTRLAVELGLIPPDQDVSIRSVVFTLAKHFGTDQDEELKNLLAQDFFDDPYAQAYLDALFVLATKLDDGHGLTVIEFEGSWYFYGERQDYHHGDSWYLSREVSINMLTAHIRKLGLFFRNAIRYGSFENVSSLALDEVFSLLFCINDEELRQRVRLRVAEQLKLRAE